MLANFSMSIGAGRYCAIVGPSGSGKSTILGLLGGQLKPTSGDRVVTGRATIAWMTQQNPILGRRTALDNACLPMVLAGLPRSRAEELGMQALAAVGLGHRTRHAARSLSGGEAQRLCLARVLVSHPDMVLADEPTGQLDAANTAEVVRALQQLAAEGIGVVVATHDPAVFDVADDVIDLNRAARST